MSSNYRADKMDARFIALSPFNIVSTISNFMGTHRPLFFARFFLLFGDYAGADFTLILGNHSCG